MSLLPAAGRYTSTMNLGIPVTYVVQWPHGFQEPWKYLEYEVPPAGSADMRLRKLAGGSNTAHDAS